jgi:HEPN domain-containing protein
MVRSGEHARMLLGKARTDLAVIESCIGNPDVATWAVGFHAQQAIEKCIKAVLTSRTIEYSLTHDLKELCKILARHSLSLPPHGTELDVLNPFAVDERYEEKQDTVPELGPQTVTPQDALRWVREVMSWAERVVAEGGG